MAICSGDANNQIVAFTNALGEVSAYAYHTNANLTNIAYPNGLRLFGQLNGSGFVMGLQWLGTNGAVLREHQYGWITNSDKVQSVMDARGLEVANSWDNLGRLTGRVYPDGSTISNRYDKLDGQAFTNSTGGLALLDRTRTKDRLGNWTSFSYDAMRQVTAVTNALGNTTTCDWCSCGALDSRTDPMTNVTEYSYDSAGRLAELHLPGTNRVLHAAWSETSELTNLWDISGSVSLTYNHQGLRTGASTPFGSLGQVACDVLDRATNIVTAEGRRTALVLDSLGRLQQRIAVATGMTNTETFGYTSGVAAAVAYTNQTGDGVVLLAYDLLGQLTNQVFSGVATNRFTYNAAGDLTGLIDGLNQQTAWSYDTEGRAYRKVQNNDVIAWTNGFNANGWLTAHWTPARPNLTTYAYDAIGNLTNIGYSAGVSSNVSLTYDKNNRLATMDDAAGHTAFARTPWGALASEDGPWADDTVAFSHNASGLRGGLSLLQPSASAWSQTCRYDAAGNLTNRVNGNFWQRFSQSADGLNQLSGAVRATDASYTVAGMFYGLATGVTVKHNAETTPTNATLYADASFVRTNVALADGTNLLTAVVADALNRSGTNTALAWLPATASFTYDANGNLTGDGRRTFAYDDEDQLVSVTVTNGPNSSTRSTFVYDALGRRRVRTEYTWLNNAWVAQSVTRYVYDHMLVLQERDGDNAPTATYTRGLDLSGGFQGAGGIGGLLAFTQLSSINPRHTYYHADAGGNITALIDDHATLLARYAYDPYGNLLGLSGPMAEQNFYRFSSKEVHANSGLYYYGYRFYEPSLQRWMNRDPAGERGGINIYGFVRNAPVLGWDPDGMDPTFAPHIGMFQGLSRDQHVQAAKAGAPVALAIAAAGFAAWCGPAIYSWALANPAAAVAGGTAAAETGAAIATGYPGPMPSSCIGAAARRVGQAGGCSARCAAERADPFVARYGDRALVRASERPPYVSGPDPLAQDSPHTVLRWDGNGRLYGAKEFGNGGIHPTRDISFTQPTFPNGTPRPGHLPPPTQHPRIPNPSGGSPRRGPEQPLQFP